MFAPAATTADAGVNRPIPDGAASTRSGRSHAATLPKPPSMATVLSSPSPPSSDEPDDAMPCRLSPSAYRPCSTGSCLAVSLAVAPATAGSVASLALCAWADSASVCTRL